LEQQQTVGHTIFKWFRSFEQLTSPQNISKN
jgi:hypothetical protein